MKVKRSILMIRKTNTYFLLPAIIFVGLFYIVPNLYNFIYAFTDWSTFKSEINFVGLKNFIILTEENYVWEDLYTTIKFAGLTLVAENLVAFILALALEKRRLINSFFRSVFFIPVLISPLATGYMFKGIFNPEGPVNGLISFVTNTDFSFAWFGSLQASLVLVALVHGWKWFGLTLLIYVAGLNSVPDELIESSRIEGASYMQIVKNIKIPLMGPAFTFNITTGFIGALAAFDISLTMTRGGPARATELMNLLIWMKFGAGRFGIATAISLILFLIIMTAAIILVVFFRRVEVEL